MKHLAVIIAGIGLTGLAIFAAIILLSNRGEAQRLWGFIDMSGTVVVPIEFDDAREFSNGFAAIAIGDRWGFIDTSGRVVIEPEFTSVGDFQENGLAWAELPHGGDPMGYLRSDGSWAIEPRFDVATDFTDSVAIAGRTVGLATTRISGSTSTPINSFGVIDRSGSWIVEPLDNSDPSYWSSAGVFSDGLAAVKVGNDGYGYIDTRGRFVTAVEFEQAYGFRAGIALTRPLAGGYRLIARNGETILDLGVSSAWLGEEGLLSLFGSRGDDEGWFLADTEGTIQLGPYDSMGVYTDGRIPVANDDAWTLIDRDGTRFGESWDRIEPAGHGFFAVARSGAGLLSDYSWGYVDVSGRLLVEPIYDRAGGFGDGLALVAATRKEPIVTVEHVRLAVTEIF